VRVGGLKKAGVVLRVKAFGREMCGVSPREIAATRLAV
jgi:hypothetical protein